PWYSDWLACDAAMSRSLAGVHPWTLREHSTPGVNWQERNVAKAPAEMARNSLSHPARGADGVMFFQCRASKKGAEKFHPAMVPHAGPDSRVFREVCQRGATLQDLAPVRGTRGGADSGVLSDWVFMWAEDPPSRPTVGL